MIDKFSLALTLLREAFADAAAGAGFLAPADLAAEVDGAQSDLICSRRTVTFE